MKNYINEIFVVRAIACLSIVLLHSLNYAIAGYRDGLSSIEYLVSSGFGMLLYFGTPTFILISEILIANSYKDSIPKGFLKKRVNYILIPYIIVGTLYAFMDIYLAGSTLTFATFIKETSKNVFLGDWHGYFVLIIFQFYILHVLLYKKLRKWNPKYVLAISLIVNIGYVTFFKVTDPMNIPFSGYIWSRLNWIPIFGWLFYFFLAYYVGVNYKKFTQVMMKYKIQILLLLGVSTIALMGFTLLEIFDRSSKRPDMIFYTCSLVFVVFMVAARLKKIPSFLALISRYSYGIYLFHMVFLVTVFKPSENIPFLLYAALTFIGSLGFSILLIYLLNLVPFGRYLTGKIGVAPKQNKNFNKTAEET